MAIQGHPEAGAIWERHIVAILEALGFKSTTHEKNIYQATIDGKKYLLIRQIDDFCLGCRNEAEAKAIFHQIGLRLQCPKEPEIPFKFLGLTTMFNGMDIVQARGYIKVGCWSYIRRFLKAHGWIEAGHHEKSDDSRPTPPINDRHIKDLYRAFPGPAESTPEHALLAERQGFGYRSVTGEILYTYVGCRLDIGYAIVTLAKFNTAPTAEHYIALKGVAKYLRRTQGWGLVYWRSAPATALDDIPIKVLTPDPTLPEFPSALDYFQFVMAVDAAHANEYFQASFAKRS